VSTDSEVKESDHDDVTKFALLMLSTDVGKLSEQIERIKFHVKEISRRYGVAMLLIGVNAGNSIELDDLIDLIDVACTICGT
jgi:hypothetical protein